MEEPSRSGPGSTSDGDALGGLQDGPGRANTPRAFSSRLSRLSRLTILGCLAVGVAILLFDLGMPRGIAAGSLYCAVILNTIWLRDVRITFGFSLLFTVFDVVGWVRFESMNDSWPALVDRGISVGLIWLCGAIVVSRLKTSTHFRMALEAAPGGMIVVNRRGRILFANGEAGRIFGAIPVALHGVHARELLSPPEGTLDACIERSLLHPRSGSPNNHRDATGRALDGRTFDAEFDLTPIRMEIGSIVLITIRDQTNENIRRAADERLAAIVRSSQDAILAKDMDGRITDWNPGAEAVYGYSAEEALGRHVSFLAPPSCRSEIDEILESVRAGQDVALRTKRLTKAGTIIDVDLRGSPLKDRYGRVVGASVSARDMTKEREAEKRLLEVNMALSHAMPGMIQVDGSGCVSSVNEAAEELTGKEASEISAHSWLDLVPDDDREEAERAFEVMLAKGSASLAVRPSTSQRFIEMFLVRHQNGDPNRSPFHIFLRDVTQRAKTEVRTRQRATRLAEENHALERQANVDPLTGLLNRRGLDRCIRRIRTAPRSADLPMSVAFVDLDDFKAINDRHGHAAGDRVLAVVANCLENVARISDPVARIGGDEFLVCLPETGVWKASRVAERMRSEVADASVSSMGDELRVTCSIGVAGLPGQDFTIEAAIEAAREELSRSKNGGKDRVCISEEARNEDLAAKEVVQGRGLRPFHQPIYDLLEKRITAFELLTRGPRGSYEQPKDFLSLIGPGEDQVRFDLECLKACAQAARQLPPGACLHFNLFPATLVEAGAKTVLDPLEPLGPERLLCIELNERDIPGDSRELLEQVNALKRAGIQIAIDDVGFGSSSLEALLYLEPEVIKIDQTCVTRPEDSRVLERLLSVSSVLRSRVIAEGVEDEETLERLLGQRVRFGQGYLWGRPAPVPSGPGEVLWPHPAKARSRARVVSGS